MNFLLLLTILFPLLCGGITFCIPDKCRKTIICFVTAPLLITAAACIYIYTCEPVAPFLLFNITDTISISLYSDSLSKYFSIFSSLIWLLVGIYAFAYMKHEKNQSRFFGFMLISLGMIMALEFSANLATMYLFFEFATISSVPLVLHSLTKPAVSAALKYLFYSIAGAFMGLLGIIFIYNYSEAESFTNFEFLNKVQLGENSNMLLIFVFIAIVGFSVKAGMFPLHNWLPAAHSEAPAPASALLSGIIAKAGVFAVIRIIYFAVGTNFLLGTWVQYALIYLSLITIIIGSVMAYREKIFKKRLAYSTVSQISYIILALSIFNQESYDGALLHVLFHATIKTLLFLCVGAIIFKTKKTNVDELSGIGKNMPITMICYTIASLGLVGIPPTCGFYSKWYIAIGALSADLGALKYIIPIVLLISALLTAGYLLPVAFKGFFPPKDFKTEKCEPSFLMLLPMLVLALATFLLVIVK